MKNANYLMKPLAVSRRILKTDCSDLLIRNLHSFVIRN